MARQSLRWGFKQTISVYRSSLSELPPPETPPEGARFSTGEDLYLLDAGPTSAPGGAQTVPAGDNSALTPNFNPSGFSQVGKTFWFEPGVHTLGGTAFDQIGPGNDSTFIGAPGAIIDGQGVNRTAFGGTASGVTIQYLEVVNFVSPFDQFVVNHDTGSNWTIEYCNFHSNAGAAVGMGNSSVLRYSWIHHNQQYGFSAFNDIVNDALDQAVNTVTVDHCEFEHNGDQRDEINPNGTATGNGRNGACKFWDTIHGVMTNNWVHHSHAVAIWADTNDVEFRIEGNLIEDNWGEAFFYEISYNFLFKRNTVRRNAIGKGMQFNNRGDGFPTGAVYISESGSETRVATLYNSVSEIRNNHFSNNYCDITLWENADRFCNSLANTSNKIWKPLGGAASYAVCNSPSTKNLTVTLTSGSPDFVVTAGTFEYWDEGRGCSGTNIPGGAVIKYGTTANGYVGGYVDATHGTMTANASASGSVTMTLAAGTINVNPANYDCRWHTQNVSVHDNIFESNRSEILGARNTLQTNVFTGKHAVLSQSGSAPSWSPYTGDTIQQRITFSQNNVWSNNSYRGDYADFQPFDTNDTKTFAEWQATPYFQDAGSVRNSSPLTGGGGGTWYSPDPPTTVTGEAGNGQVRVSFVPPVDKGSDMIVGYEVTSSPGGFQAVARQGPIIVTGLTNTTAYTFTVKARSSIGQSVASSASGSVTPTSGSSFPASAKPWYPEYVTARRRTTTTAEVSFMPPSSDGGATITGYTVTSSPGGLTGTGSLGPITVSGLTPGQLYTFTVTATNSVGTGPASSASTFV